MIWGSGLCFHTSDLYPSLALQARRLEQRIELVKKVIDFVDFLKADDNSQDNQKRYVEMALELKEAGVDFVSIQKQKMVARRLKLLMLQMAADPSSEKVSALDPFSSDGAASLVVDEDRAAEGKPDGSVVPLAFDPVSPTVAQLDGTLLSKLLITCKVVLSDLLHALIQGGEEMSKSTVLLVDALLELYEENMVELDEVPEPLETVVQICRAFRTLLDPSDVGPNTAEIAQIYKFVRQPSMKQSLVNDVALMMKANEWYALQLADFMSTLGSSKEFLPKFKAMQSLLVSASDGTQSGRCMNAMKVLEALPSLRINLRPGATYRLEKKCHMVLEAEVAAARKADDNEQLAVETLSVLESAVTQAIQVWPGCDDLEDFKLWSTRQRNARSEQQRCDHLLACLHKLDTPDEPNAVDLADVSEVAAAVQACSGVEMSVDTGMLAFSSRAVKQSFLQFGDVPDCSSTMHDLVCLAPQGDQRKLELDRVKLLQQAHALQKAHVAFTSLGDTLEKCLKADVDFAKSKDWLHQRSLVDELLQDASEELKAVPQGKWLQFRTEVDEAILSCGDKAGAEALQAYHDKVYGAEPWAGGSSRGAKWHASLLSRPLPLLRRWKRRRTR